MLNTLIKCLVLLSPLVTTRSHGFWWRSTTTEAPLEPAMKQIPLTYFRTYTYQPLTGNPLPFPLMSSTDYITNYAALANNPYFNPMMSMLPQGATHGGNTGNELPSTKMGAAGYRPPKSYAGLNVVRSLNTGYLTPPTTSTSTSTSTTTSTTPKPTTTTSTTSTSTTTSTTTTTTPATTTTTAPTTTSSTVSMENSSGINDSGSGLSSSTGPLISDDAFDSAYPAFNRKVYTNHFNINYNRPVYPFPEYSIYKPSPASGNGNVNEDTPHYASPTISTPPNVEFVPCMCPVNIQSGYPSGMPITGNPSNSIFMAQGRTNNAGVEADTELPAEGDADTFKSDKVQLEVGLPNYVDDLQVVSMDVDEEVAT